MLFTFDNYAGICWLAYSILGSKIPSRIWGKSVKELHNQIGIETVAAHNHVQSSTAPGSVDLDEEVSSLLKNEGGLEFEKEMA